MPWSGNTFTRTNGTYTGTTVWQTDKNNGVKILSLRHDTHDQDLADGINACAKKDLSNVTNTQITAANFGTPVNDLGTVTSTATVRWDKSAYNKVTMTASTACTFSFTAPANPCLLCLELVAPSTGGVTGHNWPGSVIGPIMQSFNISTTALLLFQYDGASYNYLGGMFSDGFLTGRGGAMFLGNVSVAPTDAAMPSDNGQITSRAYLIQGNAQTQSGSDISADCRFGGSYHKLTLINSAAVTISLGGYLTGAGYVTVKLIAPNSGTSPTLTWSTVTAGSPSTTALGLGKKRLLTFFVDGSQWIYISDSGDY